MAEVRRTFDIREWLDQKLNNSDLSKKEIVDAALRDYFSSETTHNQTRADMLEQRAERLREEADSLRDRASELDGEAAQLESEAQSLRDTAQGDVEPPASLDDHVDDIVTSLNKDAEMMVWPDNALVIDAATEAGVSPQKVLGEIAARGMEDRICDTVPDFDGGVA